uniref:NADH-ubiquinone oxidoreductase chain 1 n=1 Tax=Trichopria drosophilae TaxID=1507179 RepID=A0A6M3HVI3_9HYME|nr:NADH dehydrogenase subunit 1 [Trichopria drosophilae]QIV21177.1 NADH dehydrogenase subunit 1 [Trichopria drosophilae]
MYLLNYLIIMILQIIFVLMSIAFITLLERKFLSYIQLRKGPNKVGFIGIIQPINDAIKLFSKEMIIILKSNYYYYYFIPLLGMLIMMMLWMSIYFKSNMFYMEMSMIYILCWMSMSIYFLMICGWSSNSIYSLLGSIRSISQTISYEVSMILIMMSLFFFIESFSFNMMNLFQMYLWNIMFMFPLSLMFYISILAELNRTPFDLSEGESELISGFNIEYMSSLFAMIFLSEYGNIMFMMYLFNNMFFGKNNIILFYYMYMFMIFLIIWIRGTFPRIRYDNLMFLIWKKFLPMSLNYLIMMNFIKMMFMLMLN